MTNILDRINTARMAHGLLPLSPNAQLTAAANRHVQDIARNPWITAGDSHIGSDGSSAGERIRQAGYTGEMSRECTGWGWGDFGDGAQVAWWLDSPPHRAILLNPTLNEAGAAFQTAIAPAKWERYWVVDFGRTNAPTPPPPEPPKPPTAPPYTSYVPIVTSAPKTAQIGLLDYLRGDGRAYRVGNARGSFEVFQSQTDGDTFYQVKAWDDLSRVNWESFTVTPDYIGRDVDTSPGGGRFYRQFGAPWVKRFMTMGESFTQRKRVQFYNLADCSESAANSGDVTDTITLQEHLDTWRSPWGIVVPDVVVLRWEEGGELYRFGRGYGLVGWSREHSDPNSPAWSAIYAMRPALESLRRLPVGCL